jgi:hypothetical protein
MKNIIIKDGGNYRVISGNAISIHDWLPASILELSYDAEKGFSLIEADGCFKSPEKLYGEAEAITAMVLNTLDITDGNLGVLFSGPKGLGKSLTVRNICKKALEKGMPVILVKGYFGNITQFIESIKQQAVIVLDEFEKTYQDQSRSNRDELEGQESLLNLFDSPLEGKKLFLLTCNDVRNLSEYLLNRPGRLHYHFKMSRLSVSEITEYCNDSLAKEHHNLIPDICSLGTQIPDFSYDMLRSIIFELNSYNCSLEEARRILNIRENTKAQFNYAIHFNSGKTETGSDYIDMAESRCRIDWYNKEDGEREVAVADMREARWVGDTDGSLYLDRKNVSWRQSDESDCNDFIKMIIFKPARERCLPGIKIQSV